MERMVEQGILYDFYGSLLTEHQQKIYEAVVYNNLSLGEIAAEEGISRQGVHDLIKRCDKILEEYEAKLHLIEHYHSNMRKLMEIKTMTDNQKINRMIDDIIEEL